MASKQTNTRTSKQTKEQNKQKKSDTNVYLIYILIPFSFTPSIKKYNSGLNRYNIIK